MKLFKKRDKHEEFLKYIETQYENKRGMWMHTDKYTFRFDFETMTIELMAEAKDDTK